MDISSKKDFVIRSTLARILTYQGVAEDRLFERVGGKSRFLTVREKQRLCSRLPVCTGRFRQEAGA